MKAITRTAHEHSVRVIFSFPPISNLFSDSAISLSLNTNLPKATRFLVLTASNNKYENVRPAVVDLDSLQPKVFNLS